MRILVGIFMILVATGAASAQKAATMNIKLFFHNEKFNPNQEDCTKVFPTTRTIAKTKSVATAALVELFKGVTKEEEGKQFISFPAESTNGILKSVTVKNRAAYVNFTSRMFEQMGNATTSCGSGFFTSVEKTLRQFPTIKKVYYAIEGNTDDFYEWVQVGECPHGRHCAKSNFK